VQGFFIFLSIQTGSEAHTNFNSLGTDAHSRH